LHTNQQQKTKQKMSLGVPFAIQQFEHKPWFVYVSREIAEERLSQQFQGTIVVRPSSDPTCLAVTIKLADGFMRHSLLEHRGNNVWFLDGTTGSIVFMINYLVDRCGVPGRRLCAACSRACRRVPLSIPFMSDSTRPTGACSLSVQRLHRAHLPRPPSMALTSARSSPSSCALTRIDFSDNALLAIPRSSVPTAQSLSYLLLADNEDHHRPRPSIAELDLSHRARAPQQSAHQRSTPAIGALVNLETLSLGFCRLRELPRTVSRLTALRFLRVYDNQLVLAAFGSRRSHAPRRARGRRPTLFAELPARDRPLALAQAVVYAHSNKLTTLPSTIGQLRQHRADARAAQSHPRAAARARRAARACSRSRSPPTTSLHCPTLCSA
jgi:hypothetical protein